MIQRFLTLASRFNQNGQVLLHLILPDQIGQHFGAQGVVHTIVGF
jgi:hypothetical protein